MTNKKYLLVLERFGDGAYYDSTWAGDTPLPDFDEDDMTTDEFITFIEKCGYRNLAPKTYLFDDSYVLYERAKK
jgi:hypothetical protein